MPRGDRTGPMGMGAISGRGAGFCANYDVPGYANPMVCHGGMGRAWGGRGGRNTYYGAGGRGWMRYAAFEVPYPEDISPEEKVDMLRTRETWLEGQLIEVRQDITNIEKETKVSS